MIYLYIVTFLKKIEFKVNSKQNETKMYIVDFKLIKFDKFSFKNIFKIIFINPLNTDF